MAEENQGPVGQLTAPDQRSLSSDSIVTNPSLAKDTGSIYDFHKPSSESLDVLHSVAEQLTPTKKSGSSSDSPSKFTCEDQDGFIPPSDASDSDEQVTFGLVTTKHMWIAVVADVLAVAACLVYRWFLS